MNAQSKKTLKAAAMAAGLIAVLLPTGCAAEIGTGGGGGGFHGAFPAPGPADSVVTPVHTVE
jgi:hypothetical protein